MALNLSTGQAGFLGPHDTWLRLATLAVIVLIHFAKEAFSDLLTLSSVFNVGKTHLAHGGLGAVDERVFQHTKDLFGESLESSI